tara:strand:- start:68 stop:271 length:204 start_codon:yes stop_codon:yes gene_type:complete
MKYDIFLKDYKGFMVRTNESESVEDLIGSLNAILEKHYKCQILYDIKENISKDNVMFNGFQISPVND